MEIDSSNSIGISTGYGIPTGGTANQVLTKINSTNYNTQWSNSVTLEYLLVGRSSTIPFVANFNTIDNFDAPTINTLSASTWNSTTGTFTAGKTATYRVGGSFIINLCVDAVGDFYSLSSQKNGTGTAEQIQVVYSTASTYKTNLLPSTLISCNAGDVLRFSWYQSVIGNRATTPSGVQNFITIEELPTKSI
jgi:hypothetical protein